MKLHTIYPSTLSILLAALAGHACVQAGGHDPAGGDEFARLNLSNPSVFSRPNENTILSFARLGVVVDDIENLCVVDGKHELPSQIIDFDGDQWPDSIVFTAGFDAAGSKSIGITGCGDSPAVFPKRTQAEISIKEGGAWEERKYIGGQFKNVQALKPPPAYTDHSEFIRYEGPGIESDLVGYRVYLDWRNGFDIFGKKIPDMVLQGVGQDGYQSYHEMSGWGMDVLKVGDSAGMGGYGFWDGEKMHRVEAVEQRSVRILDNGPVYSQLEILYEGWKAGDVQLDLSARLAMQAGSRLVHTRLDLSETLGNIAVGIVRHPGTTLIQGSLEISGHAWTYVASWGKQSLNDDHLGMMVLYRRQDLQQQTEDEHNYVSVLQPRNGMVEYYFGAIWEQEPDGISSVEAFRALLEKEAEKLSMPLRVRLTTAKTTSVIEKHGGAANALHWSQWMADSEMLRNGSDLAYGGYDSVSNRPAAWRYTTGLLAQSLDDLSLAGEGEQYAAWARSTIDSYIQDDGKILSYKVEDYNIDKINSGKMLLRLYERTGEEKYLKAADRLRAQLAHHPRTSEGAFWHKKKYPWQLWLDGVYMGMPFLAHHAVISGDDEGLAEAVNEFLISREHLKDVETGLYYHAWDEKRQQDWADEKTGLSAHFWSRGMGWYAMALVDVLDFIPADRADLRDPLIAIISEFADVLLEYRGQHGWLQITNMPSAPGNYFESSASSMFVYMLAKAVNQGYLGSQYRDEVEGAWNDLLASFINVEASGKISLEIYLRRRRSGVWPRWQLSLLHERARDE